MNQPPYNQPPPPPHQGPYPPPPPPSVHFHSAPTLPSAPIPPPALAPPPPPSRRYSATLLLVLSSAYGIFWLLCLIGSGASILFNMGISLFCGVLTSILIMDWHGAVTLQELIQWQKSKGIGRIVLGFLWFVFSPLLIGIYLVRTFSSYRRLSNQLLPAQALPPVRSRRPMAGFVVGSVAALMFLLLSSACSSASVRSTSTSATIATPTSAATGVAQVVHATPTHALPQATPTHVPTKAPTPTPTRSVAPTPTPVPTQAPAPTPIPTQVQGVNGNPWGYDFNPGSLIYSPPADFCAYFSCIKNFPNGRGYVNECQDEMYSKSGGIQGDCSHHGGMLRPLYSHE